MLKVTKEINIKIEKNYFPDTDRLRKKLII